MGICLNNGIALWMINSDESKFSFLFFKDHVAPHWILFGLASVVIGFWFFYRLCDRESKIIDFRV